MRTFYKEKKLYANYLYAIKAFLDALPSAVHTNACKTHKVLIGDFVQKIVSPIPFVTYQLTG